jgi:ferritin heavy chain
VYTQHIFVAHP